MYPIKNVISVTLCFETSMQDCKYILLILSDKMPFRPPNLYLLTNIMNAKCGWWALQTPFTASPMTRFRIQESIYKARTGSHFLKLISIKFEATHENHMRMTYSFLCAFFFTSFTIIYVLLDFFSLLFLYFQPNLSFEQLLN